MVKRTLTAAIGLPILLAIVWVGGYWFTGLVAIVAALAAWELAQIVRAWGQSPIPLVVAPLAALVTAPFTTPGLFYDSTVVAFLAGLFAVMAAIALLPDRSRSGSHAAILPTPAIVLYAGGTLFHVTGLSVLDEGRDWVLLLLGITFVTDTAAYVVGRTVGKHRLAPSISPRKTWEGAIGGLAGAITAGVGISAWLDLPVEPLEAVIVSAILGVIGQLGDLYISNLKRAAGLDDSGRILPGHGGILDRVDSLLWTSVGMFWWAWIT